MNIGKRVGGINLFSLRGPPYSSSSGVNKLRVLLMLSDENIRIWYIFELAFVRRAFDEGPQSTNEHSIF